jgi:hypothetical protein
MTRFGLLLSFALAAVLSGCGGGTSASGNTNINGNWTATLTNPNSSPALSFTTSLTQSNGPDVTVANLAFTSESPCFASGATETGSFSVNGNFNGDVTGAFGMNLQSESPNGNTLTLQGTLKSNAVSGTWTLTGVTAGCSGNGSFTMTKA